MAVPWPDVPTFFAALKSKPGQIIAALCSAMLFLCCCCAWKQCHDLRWSIDAAQLEARAKGEDVSQLPRVHVRAMALFRTIAGAYTAIVTIYNLLCVRYPGESSSGYNIWLFWGYCGTEVLLRFAVAFSLHKLGREKSRHRFCRDYNYDRGVATSMPVEEWSKRFPWLTLIALMFAFVLCDPGVLMVLASRLLQTRAQSESSGGGKCCTSARQVRKFGTSESLCDSVRQAILQHSAFWSGVHAVLALAAVIVMPVLDLDLHGHIGVIVVAQAIACVVEVVCCGWSWKYWNCSEQQTLCMLRLEQAQHLLEQAQHEAGGFAPASSQGCTLNQPLVPRDSAMAEDQWYWGIAEVRLQPSSQVVLGFTFLDCWGRLSRRQYNGSNT